MLHREKLCQEIRIKIKDYGAGSTAGSVPALHTADLGLTPESHMIP